MSQKAVSVTNLVNYLKRKLESDNNTNNLLVEGEISNFKPYNSGHWYFSLKDESSVIRCVMFSFQNKKITFVPKDGDKVIVQGSVSVYTQRGDLQFLVTNMKNDSLGDLYLKFEELKKKLQEEGLFAKDHKKSIPPYPMQIGLITGANTAARSDVLTTLQRRWPIATIKEYPVLVQGKDSVPQILHALDVMDKEHVDVILLVRGGGSIEDLWSFNDELLARKIYALNTPIITGIGHEVDFTIADFVADIRANTPTGAAELCSPNIDDVQEQLNDLKDSLEQAVEDTIINYRDLLEQLKNSPALATPERLIMQKQMSLDHLQDNLIHSLELNTNNLSNTLESYQNKLLYAIERNTTSLESVIQNDQNKLIYFISTFSREKKEEFNKQVNLLDAYSPLKSLSRGYAIVQKENSSIKSIDDLNINDDINILLANGKINAKVKTIAKEDLHGKERKDI